MSDWVMAGGDIVPYSAEPVDLKHLTWGFKGNNGTPGAAAKARLDGKYYKLSSYNPADGFYGDEAVIECVVSDLLDSMGVNHIRYSLVMGNILYIGEEHTTPVCISKDFNPNSVPISSIERYIESHCPGMKPLEASLQLGWSKFVYTMFLVDFLIFNRDRHGANIEVLNDEPVPLFDHGAALTAMQDYKTWNYRAGDMVNNYIGSFSLKKNLFSIPLHEWPSVCEPDCMVVSRYSNFWSEDKITFVQQMLQDRWNYIEQRRAGTICELIW